MRPPVNTVASLFCYFAALLDLLPPVIRQVIHGHSAPVVHNLAAIDRLVSFETEMECRVATGRWWAPYLAHHLGNPGHVDVDHHVPLKNAHLSGGGAGTLPRKRPMPTTWRTPIT